MTECQACHCIPMPKDPENELVCPVCKKAQPNWQGYYFGGTQSYSDDAISKRIREQARMWRPESPATVGAEHG